MPKGKKKNSFMFVISLAFAFQITLAYSFYDNLVEADFLCRELKYEAADLESLAMDKQPSLHVVKTASALLYSMNPIGLELSPSPSRIAGTDQSYSILRC